MSEIILSKELTTLFNTTLRKCEEHKVEGHGFEVYVKLEGAGEIKFATTPPTQIVGGSSGRPPRSVKPVTREMVEEVLKGFQDVPISIEETATHILVKPNSFLGESYGPLKDAFIKMCGSHRPWVKDESSGGRKSHWAFPKEGTR